MSTKARYHVCHGVEGKGDGSSNKDFWPIPLDASNRNYPDPGPHDDWGRSNQPGDVTIGIYHGGDLPDDIYRRTRIGIRGTQMAGYHPLFLGEGDLGFGELRAIDSSRTNARKIDQATTVAAHRQVELIIVEIQANPVLAGENKGRRQRQAS